MTTNPLRFIWKNFTSVLIAIALAITVWVSAVIANDPNEERTILRGDVTVAGSEIFNFPRIDLYFRIRDFFVSHSR